MTTPKSKSTLAQEKKFILQAAKIYFIFVIGYFALIFIFTKLSIVEPTIYITPGLKGGAMAEILISAMLFGFFIPIGLGALYILRFIYFLFTANGEGMQFAALIITTCAIVGFGVCLGNYSIDLF